VSTSSPVGIAIYQISSGQLSLYKNIYTGTKQPRALKFSPNGQYLYATVPGTVNTGIGSILSYSTQSSSASDTLSALLNLHSQPSTGAAIIYPLLPSQPVFTPVPAAAPSTLVIT
jgi:hypothetical protein